MIADLLHLIHKTQVLLLQDLPQRLSVEPQTVTLVPPPVPLQPPISKPAPAPVAQAAVPPPPPPPKVEEPPAAVIAPEVSSKRLDDYRALCAKLFPHWQLRDAPLKKKEALLLCFSEKKEEIEFLHNVAKAITSHFFPAKVLLMPSPIPEATLIIAEEALLLSHPLYKREEKKLGDTPLFLLEDVASYIHDTERKTHLWKTLRHTLRSS